MAAGLLLATGISGCAHHPDPEPIRVGQLVAGDGELAQAGPNARQGVQLLAEQWQGDDYRVGGRPVTVLQPGVGRPDPDGIYAQAIRLLAVNRVAGLVGGFDAALNEQILRAAGSYNVPVIIPGEMAELPRRPGVIVLGARPERRGQLLAQHSHKTKARRAAVLRDPASAVARALADAFIHTWRQQNGTSVEEWSIGREDSSADLVARVVAARPDVVLLAVPGPRFRSLRARLTAAGLAVPQLHGGEDVGWAPLQTELEGGPDVLLATVYPSAPASEAGKDFVRRYQDRFHEPPDLFAAQSHDATQLMFKALVHAGSAQAPAVTHVLSHPAALELESVSGPLTWHDTQPHRTLYLLRLKGAQVERIETCPPEGP